MSLTLDVASSNSGFATSYSHAGGTPDGVLVTIGSDADPTGVTYDGESLTQQGTTQQGVGEHSGSFFSAWRLDTGANSGTVTVAVTGAPLTAISCYSLNASATGTIEETNSISGASTSREDPSDNLALSSNTSFVAMSWGSGKPNIGDVTPFTNWTSDLEEDVGTAVLGNYHYDIIASSDVACGASQSPADDWSYFAAGVKETAGVGATPKYPLGLPLYGPFRGPIG